MRQRLSPLQADRTIFDEKLWRFLDKFGDKSSSAGRLANVHPFLERFLAVCL